MSLGLASGSAGLSSPLILLILAAPSRECQENEGKHSHTSALQGSAPITPASTARPQPGDTYLLGRRTGGLYPECLLWKSLGLFLQEYRCAWKEISPLGPYSLVNVGVLHLREKVHLIIE